MLFLSKFWIIKFDKTSVPDGDLYSQKSIIGLLAKDPLRIALEKALVADRNRKSWLRCYARDYVMREIITPW